MFVKYVLENMTGVCISGGERWLMRRKCMDLLIVQFIVCKPTTYILSVRKLSLMHSMRIHAVEKFITNLDLIYFWCKSELLTYHHSVIFRGDFMLWLEVILVEEKLK